MAQAKRKKTDRTDTLPVGTNPLAIRVGKLCRLYRTARGFDVQRAAESLAIDVGEYVWLERGLIVPYPALAQRIGQWLLEKVDFDGRPIQKRDGGARSEFGRDGSERAYRVFLSAKDRRILRARAKKLGMPARDLLTLYVRRGLLSETTFATLQQAKEELDQARMLAALAEAPALRAAIEAEVALIGRTVAQTTHISELEPLEVPLEKVAQIPESIAKSLKPIGTERVDTKDLLTSDAEERIGFSS